MMLYIQRLTPDSSREIHRGFEVLLLCAIRVSYDPELQASMSGRTTAVRISPRFHLLCFLCSHMASRLAFALADVFCVLYRSQKIELVYFVVVQANAAGPKRASLLASTNAASISAAMAALPLTFHYKYWCFRPTAAEGCVKCCVDNARRLVIVYRAEVDLHVCVGQSVVRDK